MRLQDPFELTKELGIESLRLKPKLRGLLFRQVQIGSEGIEEAEKVSVVIHVVVKLSRCRLVQ
jgi:hypothetical protein